MEEQSETQSHTMLLGCLMAINAMAINPINESKVKRRNRIGNSFVRELVIIPGRSVGESRYRNDFYSIVKSVDSRIGGTGIIIIPDWLEPPIWFAIPVNVGGFSTTFSVLSSFSFEEADGP